MRILYTTIDGQISGGNNICTTLLRAALEVGHQVELVTPTSGTLTEQLTVIKVPIHYLELIRSFHLHKAFQLAALLRNRQIDLVHTHTSINSEILCRLACWLANIPIICHQHDPTDFYNRNPAIATYQRWLDRFTAKTVSQFVAVSENRRQVMITKRQYPASKVQLIHNGIDIKRFAQPTSRETVRQQWSLEPDAIAIALIARIEDPKGQGELIEAAPLVLQQYPHAKFFIIGDDRWPNQPYLTKYRQRVQTLGIVDQVKFLGFSPAVDQLLQGIDILTLPSWWEGHPLILLEGLAAQKPVIAAAVGGVPEIVIDRETGLLIPAKDPQALANAICALIAQPGLRQKLAIQGYQHIQSLFNQTQMIDQVLSLYDKFGTGHYD